jgi:hypothetical protein
MISYVGYYVVFLAGVALGIFVNALCLCARNNDGE